MFESQLILLAAFSTLGRSIDSGPASYLTNRG